MSMRPSVLVLIALPTPCLDALAREFELQHHPQGLPAEQWQRGLPDVRAVVTNGSTGLAAPQMQALPALQLVCAYGAGYEGIDLAAAAARGIAVGHAPGANDETVADHALALMLALARDIPRLDRAVHTGAWASSRAERPTLHGRQLGLVGMGRIGQKIARRAAAFDMGIRYHSRHPLPDLPHAHVTDPVALAEASDFLVLACPGGVATRHLVNRVVLRALGPQGFVVNIARGSVLHTADLIAALQTGEIAGAALDVIEGEPIVSGPLLQLPQVLLTPHVAGRSPEAQQAQTDMLLANLRAHFSGQALASPVPRA